MDVVELEIEDSVVERFKALAEDHDLDFQAEIKKAILRRLEMLEGHYSGTEPAAPGSSIVP